MLKIFKEKKFCKFNVSFNKFASKTLMDWQLEVESAKLTYIILLSIKDIFYINKFW